MIFQKILKSRFMDLQEQLSSPTEPISVLIPGNSAESPLRVQISVAFKPASDAELTKFWNSLREMKPENGFLKFSTLDLNFFQNFEVTLYSKGI